MARRDKNGQAPGTYEVGYARPPESHRFKPGQSGNPKGRPRRPATVQEVLHNRFFAPVTVTENGKRRTMPMIEVVLAKQMKAAAGGDARAAALITRIMTTMVGQTEEAGRPLSTPDPGADHAALLAIMDSLGLAPGGSAAPANGGADDVA